MIKLFSWPLSHPVILNLEPLDPDSSALTTKPLSLLQHATLICQINFLANIILSGIGPQWKQSVIILIIFACSFVYYLIQNVKPSRHKQNSDKKMAAWKWTLSRTIRILKQWKFKCVNTSWFAFLLKHFLNLLIKFLSRRLK